MPGGDGTGPLGEGKFTGRGLGSCDVQEEDVQVLRGVGRGMGRGARCFGRGFNRIGRRPRRFFASNTPVNSDENK